MILIAKNIFKEMILCILVLYAYSILDLSPWQYRAAHEQDKKSSLLRLLPLSVFVAPAAGFISFVQPSK